MAHDRNHWIAIEDHVLAPYAVKTTLSRGRAHEEKEDLTRNPFQIDRDRIIHSRAFRRLKGKTQVFFAHVGDHYRTRLSHSMEVAQVSRDLARSLRLHEDLAEAIALAHDLGHTPFGHAGEEALDHVLKPFNLSFEHNQQSKRIVEKLEQGYPQFEGLNLTFEVRQGLMKHQSPWDQSDQEFHGASLEAQVVNLADEIAYNNHDVDDGLRSGLISEEALRSLAIWSEAAQKVAADYGEIPDDRARFARTISAMISMMIQDLIKTSTATLEEHGIQTLEDVYRSEAKLIHFSDTQHRWNHELKDFLKDNMYLHPDVLELSQLGQTIIQDLFMAYRSDRSALPEALQTLIKEGASTEEVVKDYIAGMTDAFAEEQWERLVGTVDSDGPGVSRESLDRLHVGSVGEENSTETMNPLAFRTLPRAV